MFGACAQRTHTATVTSSPIPAVRNRGEVAGSPAAVRAPRAARSTIGMSCHSKFVGSNQAKNGRRIAIVTRTAVAYLREAPVPRSMPVAAMTARIHAAATARCGARG